VAGETGTGTSVRNSLTVMTRVTGVGTVAGPTEAPGLQTFSDVIAENAIATGGSAEIAVITTIGIAIGTGAAAGRHS